MIPGISSIEVVFGRLTVGYNVVLISVSQYIYLTCMSYSNLKKYSEL